MLTMAAFTPVPTSEIMATWNSISDAREYFKVSQPDWAKVAAALGDETLDEMGLLAGVDDSDYRTARDESGLNPLKKGAVNLVFGAIKTR